METWASSLATNGKTKFEGPLQLGAALFCYSMKPGAIAIHISCDDVHKTAKHYDAVYSDKDCPGESQLLASLVRERVPDAKTLLDVACGTGRHLEHLSRQFDCTGIDLDDEMLAIAEDRVPAVALHSGDMRDFTLDTRFHVVACLFSSIGYTKTVENMDRATANMASHLLPGAFLSSNPGSPRNRGSWERPALQRQKQTTSS